MTLRQLHIPVRLNRTGAMPLILSSVLRVSAFSMLVLFSAVYIFELSSKLGMDFRESMYTVIIFYSLLFITKLFFLIVGEHYSFRRGFKHTIWLSYIPFVMFIPFLVFSESYFWFLYVAAILWGAHAGLFWWGYHGYLVKALNDSNYGQTIGFTLFLHTLASVVTPIAGALIISQMGFSAMYIFAFILMTISLFILGLDNDKHQKHNTKIVEVFKSIPRRPKVFLAYFSRAVSLDVYAIFWTLYLFLIFGSILELGYVVSVSVLLGAFLMIFVGKYVDKHGEKKIILIASPLLAIAWVVRFFFSSMGAIIGANSIGGFGDRLLTLSLDDLSYKDASHNQTSLALLFRELSLTIGSFFVLILGAVFVTFLGDFKMLFAVAAVVSLFPLILAIKK